MMETSAAKAPIPAAGAAGATAVPDEPVITIISSDGETFSIRANTVAHSHLLDGAVRRWAEVYQAPLQAPSHSSSGAQHGHRSGSLPDDATTTDATADDPEETPDERFIEGYYDETASDVTATSGMIEDTLNNLNGRMASGVDGDADRPHVMRMVSVPVNDEEDLAVVAGLPHGDHTPPYVSMPVEAGTGLTAIDAVAAGGGEAGEMDDKDSDRTASVLPSSHEGSLSSSTTPTKLSSNNGEAPSPGAAPRSISPFLQDMTALTKGTTSNNNNSSAGVASSAKGGSLSGRGGGAAAALCNGSSSLSDVSSSTTTTTAVAGSAAGSLSKNGLALRSPGNALTSPVSRGSHPSPSALLDADQSTPSVLSDEEQEEEMLMGRDGGDGPASTSPTAAKADPRNLGDEGLEEGDTEHQPQQQVPSSANDNIPSSSPSPSPEATAVETLSHGSSAGNTAPRHADPLNPSNVSGDISGSGSSTIAAEGSSSSSGGGVDVSAKPPSPSSRGRLNERRHTTIVIQAGAAEDESDDVESANVSTGNPPDPLAPHDLAVAALLNLSNTPGSSRSGNGVSNGTSSASPAPDWRSPSSCHQRTPCIADEDDVGVMVGDDENNSSERERGRENEDSGSGSAAVRSADGVSSSSTNHNTLNNINSSSGAAGRPVEEESNAAAASSSATNTGAHPLASSVKSSSAHSATDPDSTVLYKDGIRITSSAIVVDLLSASSPLTSASTPMVSPQSLRENANSLEGTAAAADAQDLLSPSSAGGHTVAGRDDGSPDGHAASMNSTTSAEGAASTSAAAGAGAAGPKVNIHSSTLMLCIKYMTHFAEAEAAAAAAATKKGGHGRHHHRRGRHHRHRRGPHGQKHRGDADENSSDEDSDDDDAATPSTSASSSTASTTTSTTTDSSDSDNAKSSDDDSEAASSTGSATSINPPVIIGAPSITINDESSGVNAAAGAASGGAAGGVKPGGPAIIPMPLPGPLVARLSPWERTFLYVDVLGAPEAVLTAATAILDVCPDFDYSCPGPYLSKPRVKAALMTPPPPPEGVHALVEVMAAAKQLQIDPLHALCAGWLADFMIRVSYGATDNFEAAHLIRQCLRVPSDWSRRETDCLKLENEWPANEDAE